ncbi:hypothetical protein AB0F91_21060 [Amycolatopsis sp. NPDC023774]|uniref:hypothetical protein n=1 Tax=Amycolatopsis sp. NPDC023774 TaxID=3155015 RepID=UPI0033C81910
MTQETTFSPSTVEEVRAAVADTRGSHHRLLVTGAGTASEWGAPAVVATANAECLLQIRRFLDEGIPGVHPIQLLDASIRDVDPLETLS